jgi:hypothetical protein
LKTSAEATATKQNAWLKKQTSQDSQPQPKRVKAMGGFKKLAVAVIALSFLFSVGVMQPSLALPDQAEAADAISAAETQLLSCYVLVRQAENAGANVSALILTLNTANTLKTEAQTAYANNNFAQAADLAANSQSQLQDFTARINTAQNNALQKSNLNFLVTLGSTLSAFAVVSVGIASWTQLNKNSRYWRTNNADENEH